MYIHNIYIIHTIQTDNANTAEDNDTIARELLLEEEGHEAGAQRVIQTEGIADEDALTLLQSCLFHNTT